MAVLTGCMSFLDSATAQLQADALSPQVLNQLRGSMAALTGKASKLAWSLGVGVIDQQAVQAAMGMLLQQQLLAQQQLYALQPMPMPMPVLPLTAVQMAPANRTTRPMRAMGMGMGIGMDGVLSLPPINDKKQKPVKKPKKNHQQQLPLDKLADAAAEAAVNAADVE